MEVYQIDPLSDRRWDDLVATHHRASAFHHRGWLQALAFTYGYRPLVLTTTPVGRPLKDGVVFCQVKSWITGTRMVSLPFSDHCEPLLNENSDYSEFAGWLRAERDRGHWKYVELRPLSVSVPSIFPFEAGPSFWFHRLDLTPTIEQIFQRVHKSSIQRSIRRAEREQLSYERGRSGQLLSDFYHLQMITRRRHLLLPQPRGWFGNLIRCIGPNLTIRVARKKGDPIAALLTLRHRGNIIYKYGCSDKRFHHLGAMPLLFWKMIEESKADGAQQIDLGRTDPENHGLTVFKDRLGTVRSQLNYFRYPGRQSGTILLTAARRLFSALPDTLFSGAGRLVYRHLG